MRAAPPWLTAVGLTMSVAGCSREPPAPVSPVAVIAERSAVSQELEPIDLGRVAAGTSDITDFSTVTMAEVDARCPATRWPWTLPDGTQVELEPPKFLTLGDTFTPVLGDDGTPRVVMVTEADGEVAYRLLSGTVLACADRATHAYFLSKLAAARTTIRPFEDDLTYLCLHLRDPAAGEPRFQCGRGHLADGVTGYAWKRGTTSPRTFLAYSVRWGDNLWTHHYEFSGGLGSVATRIVAGERNGYASDHAWDLNPNDLRPDGEPKVHDWLAAIAVKTATNRNGVHVSLYNRRDTGDVVAPVDPAWLNACERDPRGTIYTRRPDVASNGTLVDGILIDLMVGPAYDANDGCTWDEDWALAHAPVIHQRDAEGEDCLRFTGARIGLNLADGEASRCPSWPHQKP